MQIVVQESTCCPQHAPPTSYRTASQIHRNQELKAEPLRKRLCEGSLSSRCINVRPKHLIAAWKNYKPPPPPPDVTLTKLYYPPSGTRILLRQRPAGGADFRRAQTAVRRERWRRVSARGEADRQRGGLARDSQGRVHA